MMSRHKHTGFSLIELLLAIFILALGIISIAALFPAGISQQQKAADEVVGSIVAQNALSIIRSRMSQEDFGHASEFDSRFSGWLCSGNPTSAEINPWPTVCGDWMWRRPALIKDDYTSLELRGAIDIFSAPRNGVLSEYWTDHVLADNRPITPIPGIPYNLDKYPAIDNTSPPDGIPDDPGTPSIIIHAGERQYPMWSGDVDERPRAQYYWDCMFRRFQGRVLVAVFVYRIVAPDGEGAYLVDTDGLDNLDFPRRVNLKTESSTGSWPSYDDYNLSQSLKELAESNMDDPTEPRNQWQFPGQWIVDQNGSIHKIKRGRRRSNDAHVVLTSRPLEIPVFAGGFNGGVGVNSLWWDDEVPFSDVQEEGYGVVTDIWFVPTRDSNGNTIVPVYAMVQEL